MSEQFAWKTTFKDSDVLALSPVGWTQVVATGRIRLQLFSLDSDELIEQKDAYTLTDLRYKSPKSADANLPRWPH